MMPGRSVTQCLLASYVSTFSESSVTARSPFRFWRKRAVTIDRSLSRLDFHFHDMPVTLHRRNRSLMPDWGFHACSQHHGSARTHRRYWARTRRRMVPCPQPTNYHDIHQRPRHHGVESSGSRQFVTAHRRVHYLVPDPSNDRCYCIRWPWHWICSCLRPWRHHACCGARRG